MSRLDDLVLFERQRSEEHDCWNAERASRVLAGAIAKREARAQRSRTIRRVAGGSSVAAVVVAILCRVGSAPADTSASPESAGTADCHATATRLTDDAGYERD
jgi:hypothetical protein